MMGRRHVVLGRDALDADGVYSRINCRRPLVVGLVIPPTRTIEVQVRFAGRRRRGFEDRRRGRPAGRVQLPITGSPLVGARATPSPPRLEIETLGRVRIRYGADDITARLLRCPVKRFLVLHLVTRDVLERDELNLRAAVADETFPGVTRDSQLQRMRNHLSGLREILPELAEIIRKDATCVGIDMSSVDLDVSRVLGLARRLEVTEGTLLLSMQGEIEQVLPATRGEYIPEWESFEREVTQGRGAAGELVEKVRGRVRAARTVMLVALADVCLERRHHLRAVELLEEALEVSPDREDVAAKLVTGCQRTGRHRQAKKVQEEYGLG